MYTEFGWIPMGFNHANLGTLPVDLQCLGGSIDTRLRALVRLRDEWYNRTCTDGKVWRVTGRWCSLHSILTKAGQLHHASLNRWACAEDSRAHAQDRVLDYQTGPDGHIWIRPTKGPALRLSMLGWHPAKDWRGNFTKRSWWQWD